jgi:hypothetical protein
VLVELCCAFASAEYNGLQLYEYCTLTEAQNSDHVPRHQNVPLKHTAVAQDIQVEEGDLAASTIWSSVSHEAPSCLNPVIILTRPNIDKE